MTEAPGAIDERYDRRRQRGIDRRIGWALGGAAVLGGIAFLVFGGLPSAESVEFHDLHYEVVDARTVSVDFEVTAPPGLPVACAVEALSPSFATVGWKVVEIPAAEQRTRRFTTTLVTTYEATTGALRNCWVVETDA